MKKKLTSITLSTSGKKTVTESISKSSKKYKQNEMKIYVILRQRSDS